MSHVQELNYLGIKKHSKSALGDTFSARYQTAASQQSRLNLHSQFGGPFTGIMTVITVLLFHYSRPWLSDSV